MVLSVLVAGHENKETAQVLDFLDEKGIPHIFSEAGDDFGAPRLPAVYVGGFQAYGVQQIIQKTEDFYEVTKAQ